jgi:predicted dehydrogenase
MLCAVEYIINLLFQIHVNENRYKIKNIMTSISDPHNKKIFTRRKFISSSGVAVGGFLITGGLYQACSFPENKESRENLEIEFIGPLDYFPFYKDIFKKIKNVSLDFKTLEKALFTSSDAAVVLLPMEQKASVIFTLLEMGKDVLTPFPLAVDYIEFDTLQKQCNLMNCRLAMLDPIRYSEAVKLIREFIPDNHGGNNQSIEILINPEYNESNWWPTAEGYCGIGTNFIRLIAYILGKNPISLRINDFKEVNLFKPDKKISIILDFNGTTVFYKNDNSIREWIIKISVKGSDLFFDSTGRVQTLNDANTPHIYKKSDNFRSDAFHRNIQDFIDSISTRKEPEVNSLDGMAGIALNLAALESARTGHPVTVIMDHYGHDNPPRV